MPGGNGSMSGPQETPGRLRFSAARQMCKGRRNRLPVLGIPSGFLWNGWDRVVVTVRG